MFAAATVFEGPVLLAQERCAEIPTAADRLACYDLVSPPKEVAPAAPDTASAPPASAGEQAHSTAAAAPAGVPTVVTDDEESAMPVVVIGMRKYPGRSATFTTDNGDVWVQIGAEGVYLPKVPFKAELRPASMGTYFLRPADFGWRVHVRRND